MIVTLVTNFLMFLNNIFGNFAYTYVRHVGMRLSVGVKPDIDVK